VDNHMRLFTLTIVQGTMRLAQRCHFGHDGPGGQWPQCQWNDLSSPQGSSPLFESKLSRSPWWTHPHRHIHTDTAPKDLYIRGIELEHHQQLSIMHRAFDSEDIIYSVLKYTISISTQLLCSPCSNLQSREPTPASRSHSERTHQECGLNHHLSSVSNISTP
jgi:hypothetical protein